MNVIVYLRKSGRDRTLDPGRDISHLQVGDIFFIDQVEYNILKKEFLTINRKTILRFIVQEA